jgi:hypothetical protein
VIQAATILDSAATILLDAAHRTWSADELLGYLNEAQRATAAARPSDFYVIEGQMQLAYGVIQNLPSDGITLIDVPRNNPTAPSGLVPAYRVITQVDKGLQDEADRFWPGGTPQPTVEHYTFDPRNPRRFVVYPPNDGNGMVDIVYGAYAPQIMYDSEDLVCPDSYQTPLLNFVLGKAYQKNSKRQDLTKASAYLQMWGTSLGLDSKAIQAVTPKVAAELGTNS